MDRQTLIRALVNRLLLDGRRTAEQVRQELDEQSTEALQRLWDESVKPRARLEKQSGQGPKSRGTGKQ